MRKATKKNLERELKAIYEDEDGRMPDLKTLERGREHRVRKVLIILVIFFAALSITSWAGFFVFNKQFNGTGVSLDVSGPNEFTSGEDAEVHIKYRNHDRSAFASAVLEATIPKEFKVLETKPETAQPGKWDLGTLEAGGSGEIVLRGKVLAHVDAPLLFETVFSYRPANFSATFEKVTTKSFPVTQFVLDGTLLGPDKLLSGEDATYKLTVQNKTNAAVSAARLKFVFPDAFLLSKTPEAFSLDKEIVIAGIKPGESKDFEFVGSFSSEASGKEEIKVLLGLNDDEGNFVAGRDVSFSTDVLGSDLELNLGMNGSSAVTFAGFGDTINVSLEYKNKGTNDLHNVEVALDAHGVPEEAGHALLDLAKRQGKILGKLVGGSLVWTKKELPGLALLKSGDSGKIELQLRLVEAPFTTSSRDYEVNFGASAKIGQIGDVEAERTIQSTPLVVKVLSDTHFESDARYYNDDGIVLGEGPLPPRSGETSKYRIFWRLSNTLHEIENIQISAELPEGVQYTGRTSIGAGDLRYDTTSRKVTWTLNRMPLAVANLETNFEVAITPKSDERGKVLSLLGSATFTASDKFNNGIITLVQDGVGTDLPTDDFARGKGRVE